MDMPSSLTAQVSRDGTPTTVPQAPLIHNSGSSNPSFQQESADEVETFKPKRRGFFDIFCSCFGPKPRRKPLKDDQALTPIPITVEDPSVTPANESLLGPQLPIFHGKKTLILDLDETLVHSSFKAIPNPDFVVPIEIEDQVHNIFVVKRPGVETFMKACGQKYEVVVFTAGVSKYANAVLDLLDIHKVVSGRLFREHCTVYRGNYVKDLNRVGRDIRHTIIVDNSPASYLFHTENAVPVESWFDDENDRELLTLIPFFDNLSTADDVRAAINDAKLNGIISH
jgi:RNA polymerase II subunit A small phosphatase-like protein